MLLGVVFLLALLLPVALGTQVSAPRSALDLLSGFSKFNLSLYKLLLAPGVGLGLTIAVYADPSVDRLYSLVVLAVVMLLEVAALTLGARQRREPQSHSEDDVQDDGLDYASRFGRLEDQITRSSTPGRRR